MPEAKPQVVITRVFNAPVEKVWAAFTESEQVKKWWGPTDFTAPVAEIDLRTGGKYLFAMHGPAGTEFDQDMYSTGTYEEIVPFERLVYLDSFSDEHGNVISGEAYGLTDVPETMRVTLEFEPSEDGKTTKLTLMHEGMPAGKQADDMTVGWNQSLDKLAESLR